jgi:hypothetical protein
MNITVDQQDLIHLLKGITPPMSICIDLEKKGVMEFCGNQYNENWRFKQSWLKEQDEQTLFKLYHYIKNVLSE